MDINPILLPTQNFIKITKAIVDLKCRLITTYDDVETNPGPTVEIRSYNTRGLKEYNKLKRLLNLLNKSLKAEIGVTFFQETHPTIKESTKLDHMWRGGSIPRPPLTA